jgi:hypothetical protein
VKKISTRLLIIFVFLSLFLAISKAPVMAQQTTPLEEGNGYVIDDVLTIKGVEGIVANILAIAITGIGFAGFVMMIVGAFQFLLAGSNSKGMENGRNTITFAIIGLIVALSSWIILNFIATFTGVETIKVFNICYGQC